MINANNAACRAFSRVGSLLLLLSLVVCPACNKGPAADAQGEQASAEKTIRPVLPFVVPADVAVEQRTFPVIIKEGAASKLSFRVPGKLDDFDVTVGRRFEAGEVVAKLDQRDYQLAVDRVEQALVEARAALKAMQTGARPEDLAAAEANYEAAKSQRETAEKQYARMKSLHEDGSASEMQFDLAKSTFDSASALELAAQKTLEKARVGSREEEIEMANAKIAGLEIDLQLAQNKLADTVLTAPFAGAVSEKFYDAHETVAPGVAILTIVDDKTFQGELSVTEEVARRLDDVVAIECAFDAIPDKTFPATIKETSTSVQKNTRSYLLTITIDASAADGALIGMVGLARVKLTDPTSFVLIPTAALVPGKTGDGAVDTTEMNVWIVDKDTMTISRRKVEIGNSVDDQAQVLSGLAAGETIVGAGARFLTDGQQIRLTEE